MATGQQLAPREKIALYPGSFDPIHNGHLDVAERTSRLFDRVIVAVYDQPAKQLTFTTPQRVELVRQSTAHLPNIEVASYRTLTVEYAQTRGAHAIVRGLRATSDFDFEFQVALMNRHLNAGIEAIFLMTALEHAHLSSTLVKEIARLGANVADLVPPPVAEALTRKAKGSNE